MYNINDSVYFYDGGGHWGHHYGLITNISDTHITVYWKPNPLLESDDGTVSNYSIVDFSKWVETEEFVLNKDKEVCSERHH